MMQLALHCVLQVNERKVVDLFMENMGSEMKLLQRVYQMRSLPEVQVLLDLPVAGWELYPGQQLPVPVDVQPKHAGILCTLIIFEFRGESLQSVPIDFACVKAAHAEHL